MCEFEQCEVDGKKFCINDSDKDCIETKEVTNTICCMQTMMMAIWLYGYMAIYKQCEMPIYSTECCSIIRKLESFIVS